MPAVPVPEGQMIEIDLAIATGPKPPGSRQLISPPSTVVEIALAKVRQGAVRVQSAVSSPSPETQVRRKVPCARAGAANAKLKKKATIRAAKAIQSRRRRSS